MEIYIGTSGWVYDWNLGGDLKWYARHSGLNAVELNMSFYRFPFSNMVKAWRRNGSSLRWSIKVHRSITHYRRLGRGAYSIWDRFYKLFKPLDDIIAFYLFQLPPRYAMNDRNIERIEHFYKYTDLGERFAVEFRHKSWFRDEVVEWASKLGLTLVSIDSPMGRWIKSSNGLVYLRLHGRSEWYLYNYSRSELEEIAREIITLKPSKTYIFFNNNHYMLENARSMLEIISSLA